MRVNVALTATLASMVMASPVARDQASDLTALLATVKEHTGNINKTLATLPASSTNQPGNSTSKGNVTPEFDLIAAALNSTANATAACDAACQSATLASFGAMSSEIAYTMQGCVIQNAVDLTSTASVLVDVTQAMGMAAAAYEKSVPGVSEVIVKSLNAAMGDVGGALATFITVH